MEAVNSASPTDATRKQLISAYFKDNSYPINLEHLYNTVLAENVQAKYPSGQYEGRKSLLKHIYSTSSVSNSDPLLLAHGSNGSAKLKVNWQFDGQLRLFGFHLKKLGYNEFKVEKAGVDTSSDDPFQQHRIGYIRTVQVSKQQAQAQKKNNIWE